MPLPPTNCRAGARVRVDDGTMSATVTSTTPASTADPARWGGVASLGLGVFALVMAEFLPASLLPRIAADLGVTAGTAGQSVTATAIAAALAGLFLTVVLPRADRRRVMIALTALAIVSNLLVAVAPNYPVLLASRLLLGLAIGGFWSLSVAMSAQLVSPERLGRAMTVINTGVSVATVAAIPLGTWLGELWGWRSVFVLGAAVSVVALVVQVITLPSIAAGSATGLRALGATLRSGILLLGLLATALIAGGQFTSFTYVRPAMEGIAGVDAGGLALLLIVYGLAGFFGNLVSGPLADRRLRLSVLLYPVLMGIGLIVIVVAGATPVGMFAGFAVWGFGFGGVPTVVQTWSARTEPEKLEQVGGLVVTTFQISIATGAIVGGLLIDGVAAAAPLAVGGTLAALGGLLLASLRRRSR
jgi:predicted MFS family arabinose efflux permease